MSFIPKRTLPITCKQIHEVTVTPSAFSYKGYEVSTLMLVGILIPVDSGSDDPTLLFSVDDGTSNSPDIRCLNSSVSMDSDHYKYVRCVIPRTSYSADVEGPIQFSGSLEMLKDSNEIYAHQLSAYYAKCTIEHPDKFAVSLASAAGVKTMMSDETHSALFEALDESTKESIVNVLDSKYHENALVKDFAAILASAGSSQAVEMTEIFSRLRLVRPEVSHDQVEAVANELLDQNLLIKDSPTAYTMFM